MLKSRISSLILIGGVLLPLGKPAHAEFFIHRWEPHHESPGAFSIMPSGLLYTSDSNFDSSSTVITPPGLTQYQRMQGDLDLSYGISRKLTAYGRLSWARIALDHQTISGGERFGLADQTLGIAYHAWQSRNASLPLRVDFQLQADIAAYDNQTALAEKTLFLGDGSMDFTGGATLLMPFSRTGSGWWMAGGGVGFTFRTHAFSSALPWSTFIRHERDESGFGGELGFFGMQSLQSDGRTAPVTAIEPAGGSAFVESVNPSLINARLEVSYQFNTDLSLHAAYTHALWGQSAPKGGTIGVGLKIRWPGSPPERVDDLELAPAQLGKANAGFVNYDVEARVMRVNDRLHLLKINKGSEAGLELGQTIDIIRTDRVGKPVETVARATVSGVKPDEAALTITEYFKEVWIEEGFLAKRLLQ